jgi:hypothetical protein
VYSHFALNSGVPIIEPAERLCFEIWEISIPWYFPLLRFTGLELGVRMEETERDVEVQNREGTVASRDWAGIICSGMLNSISGLSLSPNI